VRASFAIGALTPATGTGSATLLQSAFADAPGQNALGDPQSLTQSITLPNPVTSGSYLVLVETVSNGGSTVTPPSNSDTVNGSWASGTKLQQIDDIGGQQSLLLFVKQNTGTGTLTLNITFPNLEWQGWYLQEWGNVTGVIGSSKNTQDNDSSTTTDQVTSGTAIVGGGAKSVLIGFSSVMQDNSIANGGSGAGRPSVGTGFTEIDNPGVWNWNGEENTSLNPVMRVQMKSFSSAGSVQATFTPTGGAESYATFGLLLQST
jgi:hypothetical protein